MAPPCDWRNAITALSRQLQRTHAADRDAAGEGGGGDPGVTRCAAPLMERRSSVQPATISVQKSCHGSARRATGQLQSITCVRFDRLSVSKAVTTAVDRAFRSVQNLAIWMHSSRTLTSTQR